MELFIQLHNLAENIFIPRSHYMEYGFQKIGKNFSYPVNEKYTAFNNYKDLLIEDTSNNLSE